MELFANGEVTVLRPLIVLLEVPASFKISTTVNVFLKQPHLVLPISSNVADKITVETISVVLQVLAHL